MPDLYLLSNGTLKNKLGVDVAAELARREDQLTTVRQALLDKNGVEPPFDFAKLKQIHQYVFQDVYEWAGSPRLCNIRKANYEDTADGASEFVPFVWIEAEADVIFRALAQRNGLHGLNREAFVDAAAELFVAINNLHAFREGNGRTQRIFLKALAKHAGHELAFDVVTRERMIAVSVAGITGDVAAAKRLFLEISDARRVAALRKALNFLKTSEGVAWNDLYIATTTSGQSYAGALVGVAGDDFMMRVNGDAQDWIAIGDADDVPDGLSSGDDFTITANKF